MKVLLVEDSSSTALLLQNFVESMGGEVIGPCTSGEEAIKTLANSSPDYAMLDVQLDGELSGIEVANYVRKKGVPYIFVTSSTDSSSILKMGEAGPAGFIVKPFTREEVVANLELLKFRFPIKNSSLNKDGLFSIVDGNGELFQFNFDDISFVKSARNYCEINGNQGRKVVRTTLKSMEKELDPAKFMRIHRSYIVNKDKLSIVSSDKVVVNGEVLPVGPMYQKYLFGI